MTVYIDCAVCRARLQQEELFGTITDAEFTKFAKSQRWTIFPTRCPQHAGEAGDSAILEGYASHAICVKEHDPNPWLTNKGISVGGRAFGGSTEAPRLSPRKGYCTQPEHYWNYTEQTLPALRLDGSNPSATAL